VVTALDARDGVTMGYVRKILLFVISVAMVVGGLGMLSLASRGLFLMGGAVLAFAGMYLLWEDFIAPLFIRRSEATPRRGESKPGRSTLRDWLATRRAREWGRWFRVRVWQGHPVR
jgi:hypothetical protein